MKLGFACKYLNHDGKQFFPFRATTRKRFLSLPHDQRNQLIYEISVTNLNQLYLTLEQLATLPEPLRMMRIGSDLLPLYTVPEATSLFAAFYPSFIRCSPAAVNWHARTRSDSPFIRGNIRCWRQIIRMW